MNLFLFSHILLAHFITDYPLQTDKLFSAKMEKIYGTLFHGTLLFFVMILLVFPYMHNPFVTLGCFVLVVLHIIQDEAKIFLTKKGEERENFIYFLTDQSLHILLIYLFSLINFPELTYSNNLLAKLFYGPVPAYILTFYIGVTYGLWILLYSFDATFLKKNDLPKGFMKYFGFIERGITFTLFLIHPALGFLGFSFLFLRYSFQKTQKGFRWIREGIGGITLTILLGFLLKGII